MNIKVHVQDFYWLGTRINLMKEKMFHSKKANIMLYPTEIITDKDYIFTQPLRTGRMWHKVSFLSEV